MARDSAGRTIAVMDFTALSSSLLNAVTGPASARGVASVAGLDGSSDFQQMFSMMLMGSGLSGAGGSEGVSAAGTNMNMSSMMLPLMFAMMEQLLTKQMELLQAGKLVPASSTTGAQADAAPTSQAQTTGLRQPSVLLANQERAKTIQGSVPLTNAAPAVVAGSGHANPYGEPVHGPLTQGYHAGHNGLDFGIVVGTPVHSSMDGKVIYAGWSPIGYGNLVIVQNGDWQTYYAHLSDIPVQVGQSVQAGSVIGASGNTGNSTGPHLHYEIRYQGKNIDPTQLTLQKQI